jgi:hypothetical protein
MPSLALRRSRVRCGDEDTELGVFTYGTNVPSMRGMAFARRERLFLGLVYRDPAGLRGQVIDSSHSDILVINAYMVCVRSNQSASYRQTSGP